MTKIFFLVLSLLISLQTFAQSSYYHFVGSIGNRQEIVMDLHQDGAHFEGRFFYQNAKSPKPSILQGTFNADKAVELNILDKNGRARGCFIGQIKEKDFSGYWYNASKSQKMSFSLQEDYSMSLALDFINLSDTLYADKGKKEASKASFLSTYAKLKKAPNEVDRDKISALIKDIQLDEEYKASNLKERWDTEKKAFFEDYRQMKSDFEEQNNEVYFYSWTKQYKTYVTFNEAYFTVIAQNFYEYAGGAHGMFGETYTIIDAKSAKIISLKDIFDEQALTKLKSSLLSSNLANQPEDRAIPLQRVAYSEEEVFLTENIHINAAGITFVYQPYEIAPYAAGMPTVFFSWEEVRDLIKPKASVRRLFE